MDDMNHLKVDGLGDLDGGHSTEVLGRGVGLHLEVASNADVSIVVPGNLETIRRLLVLGTDTVLRVDLVSHLGGDGVGSHVILRVEGDVILLEGVSDSGAVGIKHGGTREARDVVGDLEGVGIVDVHGGSESVLGLSTLVVLVRDGNVLVADGGGSVELNLGGVVLNVEGSGEGALLGEGHGELLLGHRHVTLGQAIEVGLSGNLEGVSTINVKDGDTLDLAGLVGVESDCKKGKERRISG